MWQLFVLLSCCCKSMDLDGMWLTAWFLNAVLKVGSLGSTEGWMIDGQMVGWIKVCIYMYVCICVHVCVSMCLLLNIGMYRNTIHGKVGCVGTRCCLIFKIYSLSQYHQPLHDKDMYWSHPFLLCVYVIGLLQFAPVTSLQYLQA